MAGLAAKGGTSGAAVVGAEVGALADKVPQSKGICIQVPGGIALVGGVEEGDVLLRDEDLCQLFPLLTVGQEWAPECAVSAAPPPGKTPQ